MLVVLFWRFGHGLYLTLPRLHKSPSSINEGGPVLHSLRRSACSSPLEGRWQWRFDVWWHGAVPGCTINHQILTKGPRLLLRRQTKYWAQQKRAGGWGGRRGGSARCPLTDVPVCPFTDVSVYQCAHLLICHNVPSDRYVCVPVCPLSDMPM